MIDDKPTYDELIARVAKLESSKLTVNDLPMANLQRWLEQRWLEGAVADLGVTARTPLYAVVTAQETRTNTAYGSLATVGPQLTVPATGDYIVIVGGYMRTDTSGAAALMGFDAGAVAATDADAARVDSDVANNGKTVSMASFKSLAASTILTAQYRASGGTGTWSGRYLILIPA